MATVTQVVCDFCGKPAHRQIRVDVCKTHEKQNGVPRRRREGRTGAIKKCPFCSRKLDTRGFPQHIRAEHPEKFRAWRKENPPTATKGDAR